MIDGIVYKVSIVTDIIHGWKGDVYELHIPSENIAINLGGSGSYGSSLNCFSLISEDGTDGSAKRYQDAEVISHYEPIDEKIVTKAKDYIAAQKAIRDIRDELYRVIMLKDR